MNTPRILVIAALAGAAALAIGGCYTLSMYPLYTQTDLMYDPGLEGVWGDPKALDDDTWEFRRLEGNTYRLIVREEGNRLIVDPAKDGVFQVHLMKLGPHRFLDIYPEEPAGVNSFYSSHVIPAHSFVKVAREGDSLEMSFMDTEWLDTLADGGKLDLKHESRDGVIVLTASTADLQRFILAHVAEAFPKSETAARLQ